MHLNLEILKKHDIFAAIIYYYLLFILLFYERTFDTMVCVRCNVAHYGYQQVYCLC